MRRSKEEMIMDILKVALDPTRPTNLMYRVNMSWKPLMEYLSRLTSAGLIELKTIDNRRFYLTTEQGVRFLKMGEQMEWGRSLIREL